MPSIDITVVIPTIPPRAELLRRAIASVLSQTLPPLAISIAVDRDKEGAPKTRDRALRAVRTPWVAFLDDDDEFFPRHLEALADYATSTGADYVFPWYQIIDGDGNEYQDTVLGHFGKDFNPAEPHQTTITTLVRTELAREVGFYPTEDGATIDGQRAGEDFAFTLGCIAAGAKIMHLPQITWYWRHHGANTSGLPDRW